MAQLTSQLLVRLIDGVTGPARAAASAIRGIGAAARSVNGAGLAGAQRRLGATIAANNQRLSIMRGRMVDAAAGAYALHRAITPSVKSAMEFETILEDIGQKANLSGSGLASVGKRIREIGRLTNQGTMGVGKGVDFLVGMGLGGKTEAENVETALGLATPVGRTSTAYRAEFEDIAKAAHAAYQNAKVPILQMQDALDAMAKAGKEGGFELKDMAKHFPALTAAAQFLGSKGVSSIADISAALQVARKGAADADTAANNLANFFQKLTLKETINNFKKMRVDILKELKIARDKGISPIEHIMNVLKKATKGNEDLIAQIFGDKQVLEFIRPMWQGMNEYKRIRDEAMKSRGETDRDFERRMKTSEAAFKRFRIELENLSIAFGSTLLPGLVMVLDKLGPIVGMIEKFAEANPQLVASLVAVAAGLIGLKVAATALGYALGLAHGGLLLLRGAGLAAAAGVLAVARLAFLPFLLMGRRVLGIAQIIGLRMMMMRAALAAGAIGIGGVMAGIAATGSRALLALLNPIRLVAGAFRVLTAALMLNPIGLALAGIAAAGLWIYRNWQGLKALFSGIGEAFSKAFPNSSTLVGKAVEWVSSLIGWVDNLLGKLDRSEEEWRQWGVAIGEVVATAIKWMWELPGKIVDAMAAVGATLQQAGAQMIQSLWDGAVSKVEAMLAWFRTLPGRIIAAIGNINLSGIIKWPSLPSFGGGGGGGSAPGRAGGGRVSRGNTYVVGEKRAELFTPGQDGRVHSRVPGGQGGVSIGSISLSPSFTVTAADDPVAFARKVREVLSDDVRDGVMGSLSDLGFGLN